MTAMTLIIRYLFYYSPRGHTAVRVYDRSCINGFEVARARMPHVAEGCLVKNKKV